MTSAINKQPKENFINFMNATLVGGIAVAYGIINPASALGYLAATVSGAVGSSFAYILGEMVYESYNKWCHRAAAPLLVNEKTPQYAILLDNAFEQLKQHPYYGLLKKVRDENDEQVFVLLKKSLQLGYCFGSVVNLLQILEESPHIPSSDLLRKVAIPLFSNMLLENFASTTQSMVLMEGYMNIRTKWNFMKH